MNLHSCLGPRFHFRIRHSVAALLAILLALAWSSPARCDEIHDAAKKGDLAKVQALLKDHPDLVFSKDKYGETPLHWAASAGHKDVAELLLANKADVNSKDNSGCTPLVGASSNGHKDVVELLLANGADVNVSCWANKTALGIAKDNQHKEVVELLRQHGGRE